MPHDDSTFRDAPAGQRRQVWVDRVALGAVMLLLVAMPIGLWTWQNWLDQRDARNHTWWLEHSEPLQSTETVGQVVVGQTYYHSVPHDAWARAETPHTVVIRSLQAVGCGDPVSMGVLPVNEDDLGSIRALDGRSLDGLNARVLLAPKPGEDANPPCPNLVVVNGRWTFEGKTIAVLGLSIGGRRSQAVGH